jgi:tripartite tricarboxylate transporter TctB family protein
VIKPLLSLRFWLPLTVAAMAGYAVYVSFSWPLRAALFPRVLGVPLFFLALTEMLLSALVAEKEREGHAVDFELTTSVDQVVARKRTVAIFLWTCGFLALIFLVGFAIAVPVFVFLYLKVAGGESWKMSLALTLFAWAFMEGLFVRLLHLPLPQGWLFALWS